MSAFGKYAILSEVTHKFEKEPDWYWKIKPATSMDELQVAKLLSTEKFTISADAERVNLRPTTLEIAVREIAVLFGGTNIPTSETDPAPILKVGDSLDRIESVLLRMPREMVQEIWAALGECTPNWGPRKTKN
jgi:hypothetical protein